MATGEKTKVAEVTAADPVVYVSCVRSRVLSGFGTRPPERGTSGARANSRLPSCRIAFLPAGDSVAKRSKMSGPVAMPRKKEVVNVASFCSMMNACRPLMSRTKGMSATTAASFPFEVYATRTAAATKIHGATDSMPSAKGVRTRAKRMDSGIAMITAMTPPEIAFCRARCGTPRARRSWASRSIGTAVVSPGMPNSVVGTA